MKKLLLLLSRYSPGLVSLAILAGVASGGSNAMLLALVNTALYESRADARAGLLWGFIALLVAVPATRVGSSYLLVQLSQRAVLELRVHLSRRILAAPLRNLEAHGPHRLLAALTQDTGAIVTALAEIPIVCINGAVVLGCLVYLGWLSWSVLLATLASLAVAVATYQYAVTRAMRHQRAAREEADRLFKHFRTVTDGMKELKVHSARRGAFISNLESTADRFRRLNVTSSVIYSAAAGWGQMLVFVTVGVIVFAMPALQSVEMKTMTGYTLVLLYMMTPLQSVLGAVPALTGAGVAVEKVEKLGVALDASPAVSASTLPGEERIVAAGGASPSWSRLELAGVTHTYPGEDRSFLLGPVDLALRPGEIVVLVGGNGSGKTTLAKLLLGLYTPEQGEIRFDGEAVTEANREWYLQHFSVVFSDFFLFDSLLGLEGTDLDTYAGRYLRRLQLSHKVKVEGGELSTTALSQGQRKRLALLTAYLEDRPIYVFDEWAADQDPVFKEVFYHQLLPELKARGKAVLVISHDDHYFGVADRLLKLDYGRVEYDGPPGGFRFGAPVGEAAVPALGGD